MLSILFQGTNSFPQLELMVNSEIGIDYLKKWIGIEKCLIGIGIEKFGIGIEASYKIIKSRN